jgi:S-adenosyl-L-methionine hydrolase (adenosine-forming)
MANSTRLITLLTDFGMKDHFVGAMKGVMLGINPDIQMVDISHSIPPHDILSAAFTLSQACFYYPPGTIHLAVVDPGVGTARRAMAVSTGGHYFVAPDNGILGYVLEKADGFTAHEITADHYFHKPVSLTFHGRDIFAPVAAWISRDIPLQKFGPALKQPVPLKMPAVTRIQDALIQGTVLGSDHFGNLITNLRPEDVPAFSGSGRACKIVAAQREIRVFKRTFGDGPPGELFVIPGSCGYLEIVMRDRSAAAELRLNPGAPVGIILS